MEATAMMPGQPGFPQEGKAAGEHIHQLLGLAASLVRTSVSVGTAAGTTAVGTASAGSPAVQPLASTPLGLQLGSLTDDEAAAWAQNLEHLNRHLQGLMVQAAGELAERVASGRYHEVGARTPAEYLSSSLKVSRAEANHRIRLAEHFLPVTDSFTHAVAPPRQPVLGSALFSGRISAEQALIVSEFVDQATVLASSGRIEDHEPRALEEILTEHAEVEPPHFLRHLGIRAMALLDPDGQKPSEAQRLAKQGLFFHKAYRGWVRMDGYLTVSQYEHTLAYLGWATNIKRRDDASQQENSEQNLPEQAGLLRELLNGDDFAGNAAGSSDSASPSVRNSGQPLWTAATGDDGSTWLKSPPPTRNPDSTQGWRQPLKPEDIPPRPPNAPPDAIPPVYEGETWFWIPDISELGNGWAAPSDPDPPSDPVWWSGPVSPNDEGSEPWPHLVNGVWVPEPGSGEELAGLCPIDPENTDPAIQDKRTDAQKLLDGMINCLKLAASTDKLPMNGGLKPQLYLSMTQADLDAKASGSSGGKVTVPYSGQVPLSLFEEDLCGADVTQLLIGSNGSILDVGRTQRLFTFGQRKILVARDMGCAFPGCMAPPAWAEAHHIIPWHDGGVTSVDNGVLCCSLHHHYLHERGWTVRLDGNIAWFTPPYCEDINRRERRNTFHLGM
jgi:hypothetical protein